MADMSFKCVCGKSLTVDEKGAGRTVLCRDCGAHVKAPEPEFEFSCERCRARHLASGAARGAQIKCLKCGHQMTVNAPLGYALSEYQKQRRSLSQKPPCVKDRSLPRRVLMPVILALAVIAGWKLMPVFYPEGRKEAEAGNIRISVPVEQRHLTPIESVKKLPEITETKAAAVIEPGHFAASPQQTRPEVVQDVHPVDTVHPFHSVHPAKALLDECKAARAMLRQNIKTCSPDFVRKIKQCRQNLLAYTRTHTDSELDGRFWQSAAIGILWLSSYREWGSFKDADQAISEALDVLRESEPCNPELKARLIFDVIIQHEQTWCRVAPEECGQWLDKAHQVTLIGDNTELRKRWGFIAPGREIALIKSANSLPPGRRAAFQAQRERNLEEYLRDETIPFDWRTKDIWWWAVNLKTGEGMDKAAKLLDDWQKKHGRRIEMARFFEARMLIAAHGDGDWGKVREMMGCVRELVKRGAVPADDWSWKNMTAKYYRYIMMPEYEIKRQYWIERNKARKTA